MQMEKLREESSLGKGAFGEVFLVSDLETGLFYALKKIKVTAGKMESYVREIDVLSKIEDICHPNMLCMKEHTIIGDSEIHILTDYVIGYDLMEYRKRYLSVTDTVSAQTATAYLKQLVPALVHLQERKIVHRDIKPTNIIFNPETENFTLIDFGLGAIEKVTNVAGSLGWLSPHLISKAKTLNIYETDVWMKNDIYAIGAVLFFILNDRYPFFLKGRTGFLDYNRPQPFVWDEDRQIKRIVRSMLSGTMMAADVVEQYSTFFT